MHTFTDLRSKDETIPLKIFVVKKLILAHLPYTSSYIDYHYFRCIR